MARYTGSSCKLCRREKTKLFLKGTKCLSEKCPLEKRNYAPGQHGLSRRTKFSEYGVQLREKQKVKRIYGLLETQFRNYFEKANRQKGVTGANLVKLLERRLDNVVFRLGFAPSRKSARQLVLHGHFTVNSQVVDIPSFLLGAGDVVAVREKSKKLDAIHNSLRRTKDNVYVWLSVDKASLSGTFMNVPEREDIPLNANEQLIVELYSK
ncbi:MAG: 30S ribosomal protein S4 [Ignavibacteriales bacterium]|nr:MAG: small subunit ribosomal protein S4 [Stygiobacter sp.]KAF0215036.1 MAG: small subunit ribosomal protein [Ignavibacteria bacterium]MBI3123343.1 30S ribosomal protein S4 [Ignavibacteriales bacterium]OGU63325.1 MAG: 30S ribosomal protein S4 [Stygiobacter sp. GWC2_38_9]OGU79737.1 MAG: 30S ribosomal protein S4 [Stygiobacter sp. RIFOXYA12_FULL_38_9]OGV08862.1 MAG: 30S ribosomal protein S4 [Stygiobacter sp. RIFOXYB2_FULL_37_11]OGV15527.1 MAG: 30S ribosomal protein S4 [Stygiobacter sp. RIFOXYC